MAHRYQGRLRDRLIDIVAEEIAETKIIIATTRLLGAAGREVFRPSSSGRCSRAWLCTSSTTAPLPLANLCVALPLRSLGRHS
jgi:hypothetical protein